MVRKHSPLQIRSEGSSAVSKVSTQTWAFLKNFAFEEFFLLSTTLSAKHSFQL